MPGTRLWAGKTLRSSQSERMTTEQSPGCKALGAGAMHPGNSELGEEGGVPRKSAHGWVG